MNVKHTKLPETKKPNYRKRLNYVIAVCALVVFYGWLGHYAYGPNDSVSVPEAVSKGINAGRVTARTHGLVAGFRKDIPIYTPSTVKTCHVVDPDVRTAAVLQTASPIEGVAAFYRKAAIEAGWTVKEGRPEDGSGCTEPAVLFRCEKPRSLLDIRLSGNAVGTEIRLKLAPKPIPAKAGTPSG